MIQNTFDKTSKRVNLEIISIIDIANDSNLDN